MEFALSSEQKELRDLARKFAKEEIRPKAEHHDHTGEYPLAVLKKSLGNRADEYSYRTQI